MRVSIANSLLRADQWSLSNGVVTLGASTPLFNNQEVVITYYNNNNKKQARQGQERINPTTNKK
jgi:hypothetical protein